ncbi:hypothetical protein L596_021203 [Steinernema carpocapsae]|uniref:Uncharacterized protein n=1 Tax=Steinernema carpocapsae TaxID=34508 RepID=A0A4U5MW28_STECR|nr:hypothetical protein L596_021203 [Steinernema carpocapsae]
MADQPRRQTRRRQTFAAAPSTSQTFKKSTVQAEQFYTNPKRGPKRARKDTEKEEESEAEKEFSHQASQVEAVLGEEKRIVGGTLTTMCRLKWKTTWEGLDQMKSQVPEFVREYEERKNTRIVSVCEGNPGPGEQVKTTISFNVEINDEIVTKTYAEVRRKYPDALIDFYVTHLEMSVGSLSPSPGSEEDKENEEIEE